jgi:hypothetical protein
MSPQVLTWVQTRSAPVPQRRRDVVHSTRIVLRRQDVRVYPVQRLVVKEVMDPVEVIERRVGA